MPSFVQHVADWWSSIYGSHAIVSAGVLYGHLAGLLVAGGAALRTDREVLAAVSVEERARALAALPAVHRTVLGGLAVVAASGALLTLADLEFLLAAPVYYVKMAAVALLLANGWQLKRAERRAASGAPADWVRLRTAAQLSGALWFLTVLAGVLVTKTA
jgi:hypothetical protein